MVSEETEPTDVEMEDLNEPSEPLMEAVEMPDQPMEGQTSRCTALVPQLREGLQ